MVVVVGNTPTLLVHGANFNPENTTLYFDPPLPEDVAFENKVREGKHHLPQRLRPVLIQPSAVFVGGRPV